MTARPPPDARLAVPAAAAWASAAAVVAWPVGRGVAAVVVIAVLLGGAVAVQRLGLVGVATGLLLGAATATAHVWLLHSGPVARLAAEGGHAARAQLVMRVVRDPVERTSSRGVRFTMLDATVTAVNRHGADSPVLVLAHGAGWTTLLPGQRLRVRGRLTPPRPGDSISAVVLASSKPSLLGRPPWWQRVAGAIRSRLRAACGGLPSDERGLVPGLVVGDVSRMPPSLTDAFRTSGLTHLNAVSGENCAIVLGAVVLALRRTRLGRRARLAAAAVALAGFVVLARPSPSVLRAAVMGAAALTAVALGRRVQALPLLSASVLVLVLVDPFLARQVGFVLSVAATAAIVLLAPRWTVRLSRRLPRLVAAAVAVSGAAQLACTPVLVAVFGQLTPWAVPANLLAAPAVAPATLLGIATAVAAVAVPPVAPVLGWAAAVPAAWLASVARAMAAMPGSGVHGPTGWRGLLIVVAVAASTLLLGRRRRQRLHAMLGAWPP